MASGLDGMYGLRGLRLVGRAVGANVRFSRWSVELKFVIELAVIALSLTGDS